MNKILITGGAGFIGSQLAHTLVKNGDIVVIVDNFSYGKSYNLKFDDYDLTEFCIKGDIRDRKFMDDLFNEYKFDYVYNIAGIAPLPDCQSDPCEAISVNVTGFVNILELCRIHGVKTVIQASTNAMYENVKTFPTKEFDLNNHTLPTLIYPNTKYCAERFAQSYCDTYDMNVCCIRFANVYGPHIDCLRKQPPFVAYMIRELFYNRTPEFFSNGEQSRDYIYVDDLIDLAIKVQSCTGFDIVNASTNKSYSVKDLYKIASNIMNKNIEAHYNDASKYWDKYGDLFAGEYKINLSILKNEVNKFSLCDYSHSQLKYDWTPKVNIETGLARVIIAESQMLNDLKNNPNLMIEE